MNRAFLKALSLIAAAVTAAGAAGCGKKEDKAQSKAETPSGTGYVINKNDDVVSCRAEDENFDIYTSNTYLSTGNNGIVKSAENVAYRAFIPVEEYGELEYCFYFSNTVDSTYNTGDKAWVGEPGGEYEIISAAVYHCSDPESEPEGRTEVTFGGSAGKTVSPDETFWSDPVTIDVPEGSYLVWEWVINGEQIPCNKMANLTSCGMMEVEYDDEFKYTDDVPLPVFIGAKRSAVTERITAVGDSITQGCQTEYMKFEYWAAGIAQGLGEECSFYNAGLGWARLSDLAEENNWLGRSLNCDTAIIAFGTNDIISGEYGGDGGNTADEIADYLCSVLDQFKAAGVEKIIVFTAPPQDYGEEEEAVRLRYNEIVPEVCAAYGAQCFDFASYLCDPETPATAKYGGHPNGEAGAIVAKAFLEEYGY